MSVDLLPLVPPLVVFLAVSVVVVPSSSWVLPLLRDLVRLGAVPTVTTMTRFGPALTTAVVSFVSLVSVVSAAGFVAGSPWGVVVVPSTWVGCAVVVAPVLRPPTMPLVRALPRSWPVSPSVTSLCFRRWAIVPFAWMSPCALPWARSSLVGDSSCVSSPPCACVVVPVVPVRRASFPRCAVSVVPVPAVALPSSPPPGMGSSGAAGVPPVPRPVGGTPAAPALPGGGTVRWPVAAVGSPVPVPAIRRG